MSEPITSYFLVRYLVRIVRFAFPLVFWALLTRILDLLNYSLSRVAGGILTTLKPFYTVVGYGGLVFIALFLFGFSIYSLRPYRSIQKNMPLLVRDFTRNPSVVTASKLKSKVNELIVVTWARLQLLTLGMLSGFKQATSKHPKTSILAIVGYFALVYPGSIVVTFDLLGVLGPIVSPLLSGFGYLNNSAIGLGIVLLLFCLVNFGYESQDLRSQFWKAMGNPLMLARLLVEEFTIVTRLVFLVDAVVWFATLGRAFQGAVECPDNNTLSEIIEGSLFTQVGPSRVLFYKFDELFPLPQMKALIQLGSKVSEYMKYRQPAAFVAINRDKCVLIAYVGRDGVRRMNLWTESPDMTRNIVTKCRKAILSIKPYEA